MAQCPKCDNGKDYSPQGLHGHLRMGHSLSGEELEQSYRKGLDSESNSASNERLEAARAQEESEPERTRATDRDRSKESSVRREERDEPRTEAQADRPPSAENLRDRLDISERRSGDGQSREERRARKRAFDALERLTRAKKRLETAEEERPTTSNLLTGTQKQDDGGICDACEEEVEEARREYRKAVERLRIEAGEKDEE
jgi:RNA polymerase-binding transcription factor DksA